MELYFEKEYASIHFDKDNGMLIMKWIMSPMSVEYREGLNSLLVAIDKFRTGKVIFNIQNVGALHPDDTEWAIASWFPAAGKAGLTHAAIIMPADIFAQMSIESLKVDASRSFTDCYFDNLKDACDWIVKQ
jgi:hypothetical protein